MTGFAIYLLKASLCLALFYAFYRMVFGEEKTLDFNRAYLVGALAVSVILPALSMTVYLPDLSHLFTSEAVEEPARTYYTYVLVDAAAPVEAAPARQAIDWAGILLTGYLAVSLVFLGLFLAGLTRVIFRILDSKRIRQGRYVLVLTDKAILPHSFLNFIFLNRQDYEAGVIRKEIIRHECVHGAQWHTLDILLIEFVKIIFWFHPAVWLMKRSMQLNHEYLADRGVLRHCEIKAYQKTLVDYAYRNQAVALVSNFNYSFTKKRLMMMTRMKTNKWRFGSKLALLVPILMAAFLVSANCQTQPEPPSPATPAEKAAPAEQPTPAEKAEMEAETKAALKREMEAVKVEKVAVQKELEEAQKEIKEQMKVIKEKKIVLDGEDGDLEEELEKVLENLQEELEGLDINMEELMEKIRKGIDIEMDESSDDGTKRIKIVTGGKDGASYDYDFDFDVVDGDEVKVITEKVIRSGDGDQKMLFVGDDGEVIEIHGAGSGKEVKVIRKGGSGSDEQVIWIEDGEGSGEQAYQIRVNTGGSGDEVERIIRTEVEKEIRKNGNGGYTIHIDDDDSKKVEKKVIIIKDGDEIEWMEDIHKDIEVIVIQEDDKSKKKRKKK